MKTCVVCYNKVCTCKFEAPRAGEGPNPMQEFAEQLAEAIEMATGSESGDGSSLKRDMDIHKANDKASKKPTRLKQYVQIDQGIYSPTASTVTTLPPGVYKTYLTQQGDVIYDLKDLNTDTLLNFPDSKSEEIIKEIETFWTLKDSFTEHGFLHKRGFLLHGPPGSGKTSTLNVASKSMVERGGLVLLAFNPGETALALSKMREIEPNRPIIVIWEDLDTVIYRYGEDKVLALLDGELQIDNVIFIATTNYPEQLDGRITNRPSRFDKVLEVGMPSKEARVLYLKKKLPKETEERIEHLAEATKEFSVAHLRELIVALYCLKQPEAETIERLKKMKFTPNSAQHQGSGRRRMGLLGLD